MKLKPRFYLFVLFILSSTLVLKAQKEERRVLHLHAQEIQRLFNAMDSADSDSLKRVYNDSLRLNFEVVLQKSHAFDYPFEEVLRLGNVWSNDNKLRVFTWNVLFKDHFGFEAFFLTNKGEVYHLSRLDEPYMPNEKQVIRPQNWYGALYYSATAFKIKRHKTVYMLCGWSRVTQNTQFKVLDVLTLGKNGQLQLGSAVLHLHKRETIKRYILEYNWQVNALLTYESRKKRFTFDHLSPMQKDKQGPEFLGPDMSIDAFVKKRHGWYLREDVKFKNRRY